MSNYKKKVQSEKKRKAALDGMSQWCLRWASGEWMKPKPHHPDKGVTGKKTYYQTRGRVHLVHDQAIIDNTKTWCGLDLGNVNNSTLEVAECTCQRCLMHMTAPKIKAADKAGTYKAIRHNMERNARIAERKEQ